MKKTPKKYKQKINFYFNPDVDKKDVNEKLQIKDKIVDFLSTMGEVSASKFLESELLNPKKVSAEDMDEDFLKELISLSKTNKSILDVLKKIQADMIDEQDTSIKTYKMSELKSGRVQLSNNSSDEEEDEDGFNFLGLPFDFNRKRRAKNRLKRLKERQKVESEKNKRKFDEDQERKENGGKTKKELLDESERRENGGKTNSELEEEKKAKKIKDQKEINKNGGYTDEEFFDKDGKPKTKDELKKVEESRKTSQNNNSNTSSNSSSNSTSSSNSSSNSTSSSNEVGKDEEKIQKLMDKADSKGISKYFKYAIGVVLGEAALGIAEGYRFGPWGATAGGLAATSLSIFEIYGVIEAAAEIGLETDLENLITGKISYEELKNRVEKSKNNIVKGTDKNIDDYLNQIITYDELEKNVKSGIDYGSKKLSEAGDAFKEYNNRKVNYYDSNTPDLTLDDSGLTGIDNTVYTDEGNVIKQAVDKLKEMNNSPVNYGENVPTLITEDPLMTGDYDQYKKEIGKKQFDSEEKEKEKELQKRKKEIEEEYDKNTLKKDLRLEKGDYIGSLLEYANANAIKMSQLNEAKYGEKDAGYEILRMFSNQAVHFRDWFDPKMKPGNDEVTTAKTKLDYERIALDKVNNKSAVPFVPNSKEIELLEMLVTRGVMKKDKYGAFYNITNKNEIEKLNVNDLMILFYSDDVDDESKRIIADVLMKKQKKVVVPPEEMAKFNKTEVIVFNSDDLLALGVTSAMDELEKFLVQHPMDDPSIAEKTEKMVNGKKVTEIKYYDDELNAEYLRLKEEYDINFKKFAENRRAKALAMENSIDVEGQKMTMSEYNDYNNNKGTYASAQDYMEKKLKDQASAETKKTWDSLLAKTELPSGQTDLRHRIMGYEKFIPHAYDDNGKRSIGYGHQILPDEANILDGRKPDGTPIEITEEQAQTLLTNDLKKATKAAQKIKGYDKTPKSGQDVLIDMTYNMGEAWYNNWPRLTNYLETQQYDKIPGEINNTKYASQVRQRALNNAKVFEKLGSDMLQGKDIYAEQPSTNKQPSVPISTSTSTPPEAKNEVPTPEKLNSENASESKTKSVAQIENSSQNLLNNAKGEMTKQSVANIATVSPIINNTTKQSTDKKGESSLFSHFYTGHQQIS